MYHIHLVYKLIITTFVYTLFVWYTAHNYNICIYLVRLVYKLIITTFVYTMFVWYRSS